MCPFNDFFEHGRCHELFWQTKAFYAIKLLSSGTEHRRHPVVCKTLGHFDYCEQQMFCTVLVRTCNVIIVVVVVVVIIIIIIIIQWHSSQCKIHALLTIIYFPHACHSTGKAS
jgi:hypothetical protein